MRLELASITGGPYAVAASAHGVLAEARRRSAADLLVILDFTGIDAASSSFLRLALGGILRGDVDIDGTEAVPVVVGVGDEVREGIVDVLTPLRLTVYEALSFVDAGVGVARLLGAPLEPALENTLTLLVAAREPRSAPAMREGDPEKRSITPTAWNNRLNDLANRRLIRRMQSGRRWTYEAFVTEVRYG